MAAEEKTTESAPASGGASKMVTILTLVNLLVTAGIGGVVFISFKKSQTPAVTDISVEGEEHGARGETGGGEEHGAAPAGEHGAASAGEHGEAKGKSAGDPTRRMVTLEQFTVNLTTPGSAGAKFVRVNIALELPSPEAETEITSRMPQVRNTIIDLFNSKRPGDLATAEGRDYLKEEILTAINAFMVNGKVRGVFFTSFAVST